MILRNDSHKTAKKMGEHKKLYLIFYFNTDFFSRMNYQFMIVFIKSSTKDEKEKEISEKVFHFPLPLACKLTRKHDKRS